MEKTSHIIQRNMYLMNIDENIIDFIEEFVANDELKIHIIC